MKHYWAWIKGQWLPIAVCVAVFNVVLLGWAYVDTNQQAQKRQDAQIAESKKQTKKVVEALNEHTELLNSNDQQLREYGEATLCILAILRPDIVPNADSTKCRSKLGGINNSDGTFLSGTWPPLPPEPESRTLSPPENHQMGFFDGITNLIGDILP